MKALRRHLEWLSNEKYHILTADALEYLTSGVIYTYGTDKKLRPIIILNVYKIDLKKVAKLYILYIILIYKVRLDPLLQAFCFLLTAIQKNMFFPGKIENWVILIDIGNMSLFNVPLKVYINHILLIYIYIYSIYL